MVRRTRLSFLDESVTPAAVERIKALCEDCYDFTPDRDNYEYVYLTQNLINLSGKKYRQKKITSTISVISISATGNTSPLRKISSMNVWPLNSPGMTSMKPAMKTMNS